MMTMSNQAAPAARPQTSPSPAAGRMPKVGDVVWYTLKPSLRMRDSDREIAPALVVRVNSPGDFATNLGLAVFTLTLGGCVMATAVPHSEKTRTNHWSWPGPDDPDPYFDSEKMKDLARRLPFNPEQ
jgi:hypothetical protein